MEPSQQSIADIEAEVARKLRSLTTDGTQELGFVSSTYKSFKFDESKEHGFNSFFEKYCAFAFGYLGFFHLKEASKKDMQDNIKICGFTVTPEQVLAGAVFTLILGAMAAVPFFIIGFRNFAYFVVAVGMFLSYVVFSYPSFMAQITKMRAQEESILAILYMTIFMRVNPVLENAMYFSVQHLSGPLGKDLKAILWSLDMGKAGSVEQAMQPFMDLWIMRNPEFVKSFLTLHSVLEQDDPKQREKILEKSLQSILDATYVKMKHYSHNLKNPVLMLHTFGMMLPLIGLIAFPMMSIFMADSIRMDYLFFGYIVVLPALLLFFIRRILAKRPGAFSYPDLRNNPYLPPDGKYLLTIGNKRYYVPVLKVALAVGVILMIPGVLWLSTHTIPEVVKIMEYKQAGERVITGGTIGTSGEYTFKAMFFTLFVTLGLASIFIIYFYFKSIQRLKLRNAIVEIEEDLDESLFQLGNQFTDEIPIEVALKNYISEAQMLNLKKRSIFHFFKSVMDRIEDEGATFANAVFDNKYGVIIRYPSILMQEIMWIIVEGTKKGAKTLYTIMTKISVYLNNAKKIKELIYDLLTETVTSINIQAKFFSPFIAAIVGSLTFIIVKVLWQMAKRLENIMKLLSFGTGDSSNFFTQLINFTEIWPPTVFQVLVGIYLIETVILLSILSSGVQNGFDKVSRDVTIAKNLFAAVLVFAVLILVGIIALEGLIQSGIASTGA